MSCEQDTHSGDVQQAIDAYLNSEDGAVEANAARGQDQLPAPVKFEEDERASAVVNEPVQKYVQLVDRNANHHDFPPSIEQLRGADSSRDLAVLGVRVPARGGGAGGGRKRSWGEHETGAEMMEDNDAQNGGRVVTVDGDRMLQQFVPNRPPSSNGGGGGRAVPVGPSLNDIFAPPLYTFRAPFPEVLRHAKRVQRWLILSIVDSSNFQSITMNRDVWRNPQVSALIEEHFLFSQMDVQSQYDTVLFEELEIDASTDLPFLGIFNPKTGVLVRRWDGQVLSLEVLFDELTMFLTDSTFDDVRETKRRKIGPAVQGQNEQFSENMSSGSSDFEVGQGLHGTPSVEMMDGEAADNDEVFVLDDEDGDASNLQDDDVQARELDMLYFVVDPDSGQGLSVLYTSMGIYGGKHLILNEGYAIADFYRIQLRDFDAHRSVHMLRPDMPVCALYSYLASKYEWKRSDIILRTALGPIPDTVDESLRSLDLNNTAISMFRA